MTATRIAITLRLSRADDESTSFAVQERACRAALTAAGIDGEIEVFPDYGVSGASPLESREGMSNLRAWQPDYVVAWMIDRYARDVFQFLELVRWADENDVTLMTADGSLNTSTPTGRLIAVILVALAEWVREQIITRVTEAHAERRSQGRWGSGNPPWPYAVESRANGKYLTEDPDAFELCRAAVAELLDGGTATSSAERLPITPGRWRHLLRGVTLLGFKEHDGEIVTEDDGVTPLRFGPEAIDAATHARVQARLAVLATGANVSRRDSPWLAGMIWCHCGAPMDGSKGRKGQPMYVCRNRDTSVTARVVHPAVEAAFLAAYGDTPLYHTTYVGGTDHSPEMAALDAQRGRVVEAIAKVGGASIDTLTGRLNALDERLELLRSEHDPVTREVRTPTGADLYDAWEGSTLEDSRRLLQGHELRVVIHPAGTPGGRVSISWDGARSAN